VALFGIFGMIIPCEIKNHRMEHDVCRHMREHSEEKRPKRNLFIRGSNENRGRELSNWIESVLSLLAVEIVCDLLKGIVTRPIIVRNVMRKGPKIGAELFSVEARK
jgi:hypothetical protein